MFKLILSFIVVPMAALVLAPQHAAADQKLSAPDPIVDDEFGFSVALDTAAIVGSPFHDDVSGIDSGAAYVYARSGQGFASSPQKLLPGAGGEPYYFGCSVAIDGNTAVVGAYGDDTAGIFAGGVYVYTLSGTSWVLQQHITSADPADSQYFGFSVAISGDTIAVGALGDSTRGDLSGAVYVYTRSGSVWSQQAKLVPSSLVANSQAGVAVAVLGDVLIFGAAGDVDNDVAVGSAYVFTRTANKWTQRQRLVATTGSANDMYGFTVALAPGIAVVGALGDDQAGEDAGAVHVYTQSGSTWSLQTKLLGEHAMDRFGYAVSLHDEQMLVGAAGESTKGHEAGAAYRYIVTANSSAKRTLLYAIDASANATFGAAVAAQANEALVGAVTAANVGAAYALEELPPAAPALGSHATGALIMLALALVLIALRRRGAAATVVAACIGSGAGCAGSEPATPPSAAVIAAPLTQDTLTFTPVRDAAVRGSAPDTNFGSSAVLDLNRSVIAFDPAAIKAGIGATDYVMSATLELTLQRNLTRRTPTPVSAYRLTAAWTETGVTWDCATDSDPPDNQKDCSGGSAWSMDAAPNPFVASASAQTTIPPAVSGTIRIDLTSDVRSFVTGQNPHFGWMLRGSGTGERDEFTSRESSTPPRLIVTVGRCSVAQCDDGNACTADSCDATAQCVHTPVANGTSCTDGNACTLDDACVAGSCTAGAAVACVASDDCHVAGSCDPQTGACSNPNAPDDTSCGDGNACTQNDRCTAGVCSSGAPVTCTALDQCHAAGSCDPATGACSNPVLADATPCTDGNACSAGDQCIAGVCQGVSTVVCTALDQCHGAGTCDPESGLCSNPALADATSCSDANACTSGDQCVAGVCTGGNPVLCPPIDGCHTAGACDAVSGTCTQVAIAGCRVVSGIVAGSVFTPATATVRANSAASTYAGVKVCIDENDDLACNANENSAQTDASGHFALAGAQQGALIAELSTSATNQGQPVTQRALFRAPVEQVSASFEDANEDPHVHYFVVVSPISTELARMMSDDALSYADARNHLSVRLGVPEDLLLDDPNTITPAATQKAWVTESTILTNRFGLAAKMVDRGDVSPAALAANPSATGPAIGMREAYTACMNLEGIPRYDHIFLIVLENREAVTIKNNTFAPNINGYLNAGNQFGSYYSTGNPSEPNRVAITAADDFGITDDSAWNCVDKAANNPEEPLPAGMSTCSNATNHNIKNRPNLLNAMTAAGMGWRVYSETMNAGRDPRRDGASDTTLKAPDHVYPAGSPVGAIGNPNLMVTLPSAAYATKHNESVNFQSVRSAPEFFDSNRTLGGGQWDTAIKTSSNTPAGWDVDQFGTDLASGDLANLNYLEPDQCDDMHGATVNGPITGGGTGTASDCSGNALIYRSDLYTDALIKRIKLAPVWTNPYKRVAIVIMFDEGTVTTGTFSCCGWNPGGKATGIVVNNNGTIGQDTSVANYKNGNKGHSYSVFGVLNNQAAAPKSVYDSDAYSHLALVRTLQDMFQLADPGDNWTYMNRSKYTQSFIAANLMFLPEYAGSADPHFDAVRPMNHAYVIPAGYTQKNGYPTSSAKQVGPDATQLNAWALKP